MSKAGGLLQTFAEAVAKVTDVEDALRITLHVSEPIPQEQQKEKGPYFKSHAINAPAKGLVFEALPLEYKSSKRLMSYAHFLTPVMFPHLPEEVEIFTGGSFDRRLKESAPMARVKLPDGREFLVVESFEEIQTKIQQQRDVERKAAAATIVEPIRVLLRKELGLE